MEVSSTPILVPTYLCLPVSLAVKDRKWHIKFGVKFQKRYRLKDMLNGSACKLILPISMQHHVCNIAETVVEGALGLCKIPED